VLESVVLLDAGVQRLAVARLEEARVLRESGIESEVLVLGPSRPDEIDLYRAWRVTPILSSLEQVRFWSLSVTDRHPIHLKIDTGMQRLGPRSEFGRALEVVRGSRLSLTGLCSHLADAEEPASERNAEQLKIFDSALGLLRDEERSAATVHVGASSAALHLDAARYDALRVGLALFGYDSAGIESLAPVMRVSAELLDVRSVAQGERIGYGGTWVAKRDSRIGVLGIGYADGLPRSLSNEGEALLRGRRVPIVGRISMDLTLVDITDTGGDIGEECVLLGEQGKGSLDAAEIARWAGTIPYEIVCALGVMRLARTHRDGGTVP